MRDYVLVDLPIGYIFLDSFIHALEYVEFNVMTSHLDQVARNVVILNRKHCHSFLLQRILLLQSTCDAVECFDLERFIEQFRSEVSRLSSIAHFLKQLSEGL